MHTIHIRGPQPMFFFISWKSKYSSFYTATFLLFQEHFYVFFTEGKKSLGKKTVTAHTQNRHSSTCRFCMFTKSSRVSHNYIFIGMIVFLLLRMGLSKNALREREGFAVYKNKRWSERGNVCSGWVCQKMLGQRDRGLWCREARGEEREVTCPFWIFVAGKDVEGSDPLQTRAFPVEGHVGFFG